MQRFDGAFERSIFAPYGARLHAIVDDAALRGAPIATALQAAGIAWHDVGASDPRRDALMRYAPIEGVARSGGSTTQSLARGAGSVETDYLNGEIVLLGRLYAVPVPATRARSSSTVTIGRS